MREPSLSDGHLRLIAVTYEGFLQAGTWPTASFVDATLDHDFGLDMDAVLLDIPPGVVVASAGYNIEHSVVQVTVAGLHQLEAARGDLAGFVALVRTAAERERRERPGPREVGKTQLTNADAGEIWHGDIDAERIARVFAIAQVEAVNAGSSGPGENDDWTMWFDRGVRRYRGLDDIDDYLARRPDPIGRKWTPPPPAEPYVFILMPFEEEWSNNIKDTIDQACEQISRQFAGFRWQRADEITEPGRITDQIVSAIERADVLVADITGTNANVLFELGFADALNKPIIVLNQDVSATPFDIKDWRQIVYSPEALHLVRQSLVDFLVGTLRTRGFAPAAAP